MPIDAGMAIVLWIGIVITAQAFQATPPAHAPAVVVGSVPGHRRLGPAGADADARRRRRRSSGDPGLAARVLAAPAAFRRAGLHLDGLVAISQGFMVTCMVWSAMSAHLIDGAFRRAASWAMIGARRCLLRFRPCRDDHAGRRSVRHRLGTGWRWAVGYVLCASFFLGAPRGAGAWRRPPPRLAPGALTPTIRCPRGCSAAGLCPADRARVGCAPGCYASGCWLSGFSEAPHSQQLTRTALLSGSLSRNRRAKPAAFPRGGLRRGRAGAPNDTEHAQKEPAQEMRRGQPTSATSWRASKGRDGRCSPARGFDATTTRAIAERAGIASAPFLYFPEKKDLLIHLFHRDVAAVEAGRRRDQRRRGRCGAARHMFDELYAYYARDLALSRVFIQELLFLERRAVRG